MVASVGGSGAVGEGLDGMAKESGVVGTLNATGDAVGFFYLNPL
jgi:hypothetical protein